MMHTLQLATCFLWLNSTVVATVAPVKIDPNPTALMQSAVLMLAHLGEREAAARLQRAIYQAYATGDRLTGDVGGNASTSEFTAAVIRHL